MTPDELATLRRLAAAWQARARVLAAQPEPEVLASAALELAADDLLTLLAGMGPLPPPDDVH